MHRIAVVGDKESIYGFSSVGMEIFPADISTGASLLRRLAAEGYGVIYMTEGLYAQLQKEIGAYLGAPVPAIIPIPGASGNTGIGMAQVKKSVERAVGSDIIFGEK